ncbi:hypothetical protein FSP39_005242 [Pinctada imbricata]|uniref:Amine oxidase n=1 Tax=Pinctada imbricata TaxID=66713 RepID=A0AA88XYX8_PINIB|nr:hypothetical protein FSP39_005242 [Pinctada imbricata]
MTTVSGITREKKDKRLRCNSQLVLRLVAVISTILCIILLAVIIVLAVLKTDIPVCQTGSPVIPRDFDSPRVFDGLTVQESRSVRDYLLKIKSLSLVPISKARPNNSYIYMIDLHMPLKDAVLRHLDVGYKQPERTAKVVLVRGDQTPPRVEEYLVGPLPNPSYQRKVTNPSYTTSTIPYAAKPGDSVDYKYLFKILEIASYHLYPVLYGSYRLSYHNCTKNVDCMEWWDIAPKGRGSDERKTWFWAFRDVEGFYLHPLGLEIQIDHISTDVADWKITKIVYNGQLFYDVEDLVNRYVSKGNAVYRMEYEPLGYKEHLYSSYTRRGKSEMPEPKQGPKLVEPDGRRFTVDGHHISYMHWDFNVRMRTSSGLVIYDIRFQNERIVYELSLQDAVVFYSGYGPAQGISNYYDTSWIMGAMNFELVPGVDCPETAVFLDVDHFVNANEPFTIRHAVCVFEDNGNLPLRRHFSSDFEGGYTYYAGLVDYNLVVRTIANIWNYDYIFDYIFHLNGAIETRVSATGYVQSTYALPREKKYGYPIYNNVVANLHQHLFHFKVDLDVNGMENSYSTLEISTEKVGVDWAKPKTKTQMIYNEKIMMDELEAGPGQQNNFDTPKYDVIINLSKTNKYDSRRAYRILNFGKSRFLLEDSDVTKAGRWAKYPISVTLYNDAEEMSTSIYAQNYPWEPVVDFEKFIQNNDSIYQRDIVAWVTMGVMHIPHTEDVPSTTTAGSQLRFFLLPFNYFTECPSVSSPNTVKITPRSGLSDVNVETYGTSFQSTCAQKEYGPTNFNGRTKT